MFKTLFKWRKRNLHTNLVLNYLTSLLFDACRGFGHLLMKASSAAITWSSIHVTWFPAVSHPFYLVFPQVVQFGHVSEMQQQTRSLLHSTCVLLRATGAPRDLSHDLPSSLRPASSIGISACTCPLHKHRTHVPGLCQNATLSRDSCMAPCEPALQAPSDYCQGGSRGRKQAGKYASDEEENWLGR